MDVFKEIFGSPNQIYVLGLSQGGAVTAQVIEANIGNVVGALPACGLMAGSRHYDGVLDTRLVYDAICAEVEGAFIPGGGTGLPEIFTQSDFTGADLNTALQACFGLFSPTSRDANQTVRLQKFLDETKMPEEFVASNMASAVFALSDLIFHNRKLNGKQGVGNAGVQYDDPEINAKIERIHADQAGVTKLQNHFLPTGEVGNVKIVSINESKDARAFVDYQSVLSGCGARV